MIDFTIHFEYDLNPLPLWMVDEPFTDSIKGITKSVVGLSDVHSLTV